MRDRNIIVPRYVVPNEIACIICSGASSASGGSSAVPIQRTMPPAEPIRMKYAGHSMPERIRDQSELAVGPAGALVAWAMASGVNIANAIADATMDRTLIISSPDR